MSFGYMTMAHFESTLGRVLCNVGWQFTMKITRFSLSGLSET